MNEKELDDTMAAIEWRIRRAKAEAEQQERLLAKLKAEHAEMLDGD